jgi:DNA-3-methyladenine glycosylase II
MFRDKILLALVKKYPAPEWSDRSEFLFEDLVDTIIAQQLSGKAATSIFNRFKALFTPGVDLKEARSKVTSSLSSSVFPTPEAVLAVPPEILRSIGISTAKASYIHNVARAFVEGKLEKEKIREMTDEEVILALTQIKGIGRWSAEMILIFTLNRPDVFSMGDLGLRKAIENLYGISDKGTVLDLTHTWSPHRSLASWYLWRSLENG